MSPSAGTDAEGAFEGAYYGTSVVLTPASFFVLAFGLSWLGWIPYVLSRSGMGILDFDCPALLGTTQLAGVPRCLRRADPVRLSGRRGRVRPDGDVDQ